jgi:NAD(P)-dependent dehydrogenase (short-subunit alcohol dehydrogenase family)
MTTNQATSNTPAVNPNALQGKRAVVTGGTIGMGLAIVRALTARGAQVLYTGRSAQRLAEAQAALNTPLAHPVRSDATDMADLASLADQASALLGGIDYLFVNQGIAEFQTLEDVTEESWDRIFDVNTKGSFFTVQRLAPLIAEGGSILFTTVSNDEIFPGLSAYSGAKEAVAAFAKVLAAELLPRGIRVNALAPGFILTPTMGRADRRTASRIHRAGQRLHPDGPRRHRRRDRRRRALPRSRGHLHHRSGTPRRRRLRQGPRPLTLPARQISP